MTADVAVDGAAAVRRLFEFHLDVGLHHGAQLAVYADGDPVLSIAGGATGPDGDGVSVDDRFLLFSCTKPLVATCVHRLADEGQLDYGDPVRDHWPEFADPNTEKGEITVGQVLSHRAGVPKGPFDERFDRWDDWEAAMSAMESIEPSHEPGVPAYHPMNYGWLVGGIVEHVAGIPLQEYVLRGVCEPMGLEHTSIGLPAAVAAEPADVATVTGFDDFDRARRPGRGINGYDNAGVAAVLNDPRYQRVPIPAANGVGTARDLARFVACYAGGGTIDGRRVLSERAVRAATSVQGVTESDPVLDVPIRYGMGFTLSGAPWDDFGTVTGDRVFGHYGMGSVVCWGDPDRNLAMAYLTNGIRAEYENLARMTAMSSAVREVFGC